MASPERGIRHTLHLPYIHDKASVNYTVRLISDGDEALVDFELVITESKIETMFVGMFREMKSATPTITLYELHSDDPILISEIMWIAFYWYFTCHPLHEAHAPSDPKTPKLMRSLNIGEGSKFMGGIDRTELEELWRENIIDMIAVTEGSKEDLSKDSKKSGPNKATFIIHEPSFWQLSHTYFCNFYSEDRPVCPKPPVYILTNNIRHPRRPLAPLNLLDLDSENANSICLYKRHIITSKVNSIFTLRPCDSGDAQLLNKWMNHPRVNHFWGEAGPLEKTEKFIANGLASTHTIPVIGSWEDFNNQGRSLGVRPACYFEIYWVKEDHLARYAEAVGDWDRGVHVLVGEDWARGRVNAWMSSLIHYMFLDDPRTQCLYLEPRVDNTRFIELLTLNGFYKEKEFAFPHKQAALMRLRREAWEGVRDEETKKS